MNKCKIVCTFVSMLMVGVIFAPSFGNAELISPKGDWPMYGYDSRHVGYNKTVQNVPRTNFTIWKSPKLDGPFDNVQPIVYNGTIFIGTSAIGGTEKGAFYALYENNGTVKWKISDISIVLSSAVVHATSTEEYVIFGCKNSHVLAVHAKNGTLVWKFDTAGAGAKIDNHITYNSKKKNVYFTTMTYTAVTPNEGNYTLRCYALNAKTGQPDSEWMSRLGLPYWEFRYSYEDMIPGQHQSSTPAVDYDSGLIFLASAYAEKISGVWRKWGKLFAIDLSKGETKWVAELDALPNAGPVVGTDHVYVGTQNGTVYAFPKIDPTPTDGIMEDSNLYWLYQCRDWDMNPMPITNGMVLAKLTKPANREVLIFGAAGPASVANGRLYALDAHGTKDAADGYGFQPSVANGLSSDRNISAEILWFYQWDGDQNLQKCRGFEKGPCSAGGMVYVAGRSGKDDPQLFGFQLNGRYDKLDGPINMNPQGVDLMYDLIWYYQGTNKDDGKFGIPCIVNNKLIIGDSKGYVRAIGNAPPQPKFSVIPPNNAYKGEEVTFNANASKDPNGDKMWFNWSFGDSQSDSLFSIPLTKHIYLTVGTYLIILTVDDGEYKNSSKPYNLTVINRPKNKEPEVWETMWFWAILIVVIVVLVILILMLTRKKKGPTGYGGSYGGGQQGLGPGGGGPPYAYRPPGR